MNIRRSIEWIAFAASSAVILYAGFAAFEYTLGPGFDNCVSACDAPVTSERGVRAEAMARYCTFFGVPNEKRLSLHLSDDSGDSALVSYEPRKILLSYYRRVERYQLFFAEGRVKIEA